MVKKAQLSLETIVIVGAVLLVLVISGLYLTGYLGEPEPECRDNVDCLTGFECINETCVEIPSQICGNGIIEDPEICDVGSILSNCSAEKGITYTGTLGCSNDCLSYDTSECERIIICGDGYCNGDENCSNCAVDCNACPTCGDGNCDLNENCSNCSLDCGVCAVCNNGLIETGELCDGLNITSNCSEELLGDYIGDLTCSNDCLSYNVSACISASDPDLLEFACNDSVDITLEDKGIGFGEDFFDQPDNFGTPNCCGDDENEWYLIARSNYTGSLYELPSTYGCCDEVTDCVSFVPAGNCYDSDSGSTQYWCFENIWNYCTDGSIDNFGVSNIGKTHGTSCCTSPAPNYEEDRGWQPIGNLKENDYSCSDGYDNDCDGLIDCDDIDCAEETNCLTRPLSLVGDYNTAGDSQDVFVINDYSYLADRSNGLVIINVANKASPSKTGRYYASSGDYYGVYVKGETAFVADWVNGLIVVDVSNKAIPVLKGSYDTNGNPLDVFVKDNYAYVADSANGLVILDISNENTPVKVGHYDTDYLAQGIFVKDNYAFVADGNDGIIIIDVTDKTDPLFVSKYDTDGSAKDVFVEGEIAFVADGSKGFLMLDVTNKNTPVEEWSYDTSGDSRAVAVENGFAFVSDYTGGIEVFYVGNPSKYQRTTSGLSYSVGVSAVGSYVYSAGGSFGLQIAELG